MKATEPPSNISEPLLTPSLKRAGLGLNGMTHRGAIMSVKPMAVATLPLNPAEALLFEPKSWFRGLGLTRLYF